MIKLNGLKKPVFLVILICRGNILFDIFKLYFVK
jgi:hypothetical protein